MIDASTLFIFFRFAGVEHHTITWFKRAFEPEHHTIAQYPGDFAQIHPAFLPKTGVNQFLVVGAAKPAGVQAAAEGHFQVVLGGSAEEYEGRGGGADSGFALDSRLSTLDRRIQRIQRLSVNARDIGDILRRFEAAFDFEEATPPGPAPAKPPARPDPAGSRDISGRPTGPVCHRR